ncbi:MAG: (d)CMP kinase [Bacteroidota bacterium]
MKKIVVALDGYSGTGKSSTAKQVAAKLGYTYIDSGAMYRAVTLHFLQSNVDIDEVDEIKRSLNDCNLSFQNQEMHLNGVRVEDDIRTMKVSERVSQVSAVSEVRLKLVEQQREMGESKGVVMDGRDIGTVVFPDAELKLFMTANMDVRTERRRKQLEEKGIVESLNSIKENLEERDRKDSSREDSPLKMAEDGIEIDTSHLTLNEQIEKIVALAEEIIHED